MKKSPLLLVLFCCFCTAFAQPRKIYLVYDKVPYPGDYGQKPSEPSYAYKFVSSSDSAFVHLKISGSGDMGVAHYHPYIVFTQKIQDGVYEIYLENHLLEKISFKNHLRQGLHARGFGSSQINIQRYNADTVTESYGADRSGNILRYSPHYNSDRCFIDYYFSVSRELSGIRYWSSEGTTDRIVSGRLVERASDEYYTNPIRARYGIANGGRVNGKMTVVFEKDKYIIWFNEGVLQKVQLLTLDDKLIWKSTLSSHSVFDKAEEIKKFISPGL